MKFISGFMSAIAICIIAIIFGYLSIANPKIIDRTVITIPVAEGVKAEDVIASMESKAAEINIKFVNSIPLHKELYVDGVEAGHLEIFDFCNPEDAKIMTDISLSFAAYLPCRIVLIDRKGRLYLTMLDLSLIIKAAALDGKLLEIASKMNENLHSIIKSGAAGHF